MGTIPGSFGGVFKTISIFTLPPPVRAPKMPDYTK